MRSAETDRCHPWRGQRGQRPVGRPSQILVLCGAIVFLALVGAAPARGGAYRAGLCNPGLGAGHADAAFARSSPRFLSRAACAVGGDGLSVKSRTATRGGRWGAWIVPAPPGTVIRRLSVSAAGAAGGGKVPELLRGPKGRWRPFATPSRDLARFRWSGAPTRGFAARLRCRRLSGCPRGRPARLRVKRLALLLDDRAGPRLGVAGSLFASGSRRGSQVVGASATDTGAGIRGFLLQVNGQPLAGHTLACRLADGVATRLRPCRQRASTEFRAVTASPPFRQGPNAVRVCASDYAGSTAANRACATRRIRVDNLCPLSRASRGATVRARLGRQGAGAIVTGRLLDREGRGVSGARMCVATRARLRGVAERVVATPLTDSAGRFRAALARGPNREVRIAYWASAATVIERALALRVPARPRLRLRPDRPIPNGERVRFLVRLPGPASGHRRVRIQVRAGERRWLQLRAGITAPNGAYRAAYRFHATTGRRTYAFRAVVPKQNGYPYEAGRSKVKRAVVVG
jgi:hypothetical protein